MDSRVCKECDVKKDIEEFTPCGWRGSVQRRRSRCSECRNASRRQLTTDDPLYQRRMALWQKYKLTIEDYDRMLAEQGGVCAICDSPPKNVALHVDHDHACCPGKITCGKCIRGLVCWNCNVFIGKLEGRCGKKALAYLRKWKGRVVMTGAIV